MENEGRERGVCACAALVAAGRALVSTHGFANLRNWDPPSSACSALLCRGRREFTPAVSYTVSLHSKVQSNIKIKWNKTVIGSIYAYIFFFTNREEALVASSWVPSPDKSGWDH